MGTDSFTFAASDGVTSSAPTNIAITVVRPVLSKLSIHPHRFSRAGRNVNGHCVPPTKTNKSKKPCRRTIKLHVSYALNASDVVTFTVKRQVPGRKVKGRCVTPTSKNMHDPGCVRLVKLRGKLTRSSVQGINRFIFNGRLGGHTLRAGTYVLIATPAGGKPSRVAFNIVA